MTFLNIFPLDISSCTLSHLCLFIKWNQQPSWNWINKELFQASLSSDKAFNLFFCENYLEIKQRVLTSLHIFLFSLLLLFKAFNFPHKPFFHSLHAMNNRKSIRTSEKDFSRQLSMSQLVSKPWSFEEDFSCKHFFLLICVNLSTRVLNFSTAKDAIKFDGFGEVVAFVFVKNFTQGQIEFYTQTWVFCFLFMLKVEATLQLWNTQNNSQSYSFRSTTELR